MTKALIKARQKHLDFIDSLDIDEDVKNEAIGYILSLETDKKEALRVDYVANEFRLKLTSTVLMSVFVWEYSKNGDDFWVYIIDTVENKEAEK